LALPRFEPERLRDFAAFLRVVLTRSVFLICLGSGLSTRAVALLTAGLSRPSLAAFPAIAPTIPPTTAPAGPIMLPSAAPATAPAVSFGMGGTSMFSSVFEFSAINKLLDSSNVIVSEYFAVGT
jgi:hypothetical protein